MRAETRGRKPGTLARFKCIACGTECLVSGGGAHFRCSDCKTNDFGNPYEKSLFKGQAEAQSAVAKAIRQGKLKHPSAFNCTDCDCNASEYDHRDYSKPLDVEPVCRVCNQWRGPAIPIKGFFRAAFERQEPPYVLVRDAQLLLTRLGIKADIHRHMGYLTFEHWLPFKDALLEWEEKLSISDA